MEFIRYGSLALQSHNIKNDSYHTAPVKKGIYAFPKGYVEEFLISGVGGGSIENGRYHFIKDKKGQKIKVTIDDFEWDRNWCSVFALKDSVWKKLRKIGIKPRKTAVYLKNQKKVTEFLHKDDFVQEMYLVKENHPTRFKHNGKIWHHLDEVTIWYDGKPCKDREKRLIPKDKILKESGSWVLTDIKTYEKALKKYVATLKYMFHGVYCEVKGFPSGFPLNDLSFDNFEVYIEKL